MLRPDDGLIEFRLLGPVEAVRGDHAVPLGGPRQRALLALLLIESGRPIAADRLAEELWSGRPPKGSATTLRAYISKLRAAVGAGAEISAETAGYALAVAPERVDVRRFERLAREGHQALSRGSARRAADRLGEALDLWRGLPFAGLGDEGALRDEVARLVELRLLALEDRIEADLALGRDAELVDELERLLGDHPYRERLWRQLMLALYRAGRQADALAAYARAREVLVAELGLEPGEELKLLEHAILRHEVPRAEPPEARHNLPAPLTSFVGREAELADIERLLGEARLVTLTGVGGAGKTRLGLEAAARSIADLRDGVTFVDFSALAEPELVPHHVAAALEVREQPDTPVVEQLKRRLRDVELLLVLDNCEHLREACATVSHDLLVACPSLQILATSRQLLGVAGEVDYSVPPLAVPAADADPDELRSSEAVRLFLARARDARPLLEDDDRSVSTAALICRDLDGLPLAIELAAARAKALSVDEIANRLADRFRFLVSWRRLTAARHRTLRETMDWSYELLSEEERLVLARLSVFAGGCTLSGAASVCLDGDGDAAAGLIGRLVDVSLVTAEERDGGMRYGLLETVRQYAAERLEERGETALLRRRHTEFFIAFAENAWEVHSTRLDGWMEHVGDEHGNLRAALSRSRDSSARLLLARLTSVIWQFWWIRGELSEGRAWLEDALEGADALEPVLRAGVVEGAASLAWASGDLSRTHELAVTALALFAAVEDRRGECGSLTLLGHVALAQEDFRAAEALFERARDSAEEMPSETKGGFVAVAMHNLGSVALGEGNLGRAAHLYETALSIFHAGAPQSYGVALSELYLGLVAVEAGRSGDAAEYLARALPVFREMGFRQYSTQCLEGIAVVALARGKADEAARLFGAADSLHDVVGHAPVVALPRRREQAIASVRAELGEPLFAVAWSEGRALSEAEALDRAQRSAGL